ncbi:MAG: hypothetical protein NZM05_00915 [Chloroherpetonaceae bacterium]|nr:hypothetical protein [Chloroherpetonaceae bacterium]MCS7210172.1 hypothetical protein [Chloroherpetonaceae bacterium]
MSEPALTSEHKSPTLPELPSPKRSMFLGALVYFVIGIIPFVNQLNRYGIGLVICGGLTTFHYIKTHQLFLSYWEAFRISVTASLLACLALDMLQLLLFGGYVVRLLYDIAVAIVVGGLAGIISASVARKAYRTNPPAQS